MSMKRFLFGFILTFSFGLVLYASYRFLNIPTYKIRFNSSGGAKIETILVKENQVLSSLPEPTRQNYDFVGWYNDTEPFDLNIKITHDYVLTAVWEESAPKTFNIYFDTLNGEIINSFSDTSGTTITNLPTASKEGYQFIGWYYHNKKVQELTLTQDITLVAKYQKIA